MPAAENRFSLELFCAEECACQHSQSTGDIFPECVVRDDF